MSHVNLETSKNREGYMYQKLKILQNWKIGMFHVM